MKDIYQNKNKQIVLYIPKFKPHPIKTLLDIFDKNMRNINIDFVPDDERIRLGEFIKNIKSLLQNGSA